MLCISSIRVKFWSIFPHTISSIKGFADKFRKGDQIDYLGAIISACVATTDQIHWSIVDQVKSCSTGFKSQLNTTSTLCFFRCIFFDTTYFEIEENGNKAKRGCGINGTKNQTGLQFSAGGQLKIPEGRGSPLMPMAHHPQREKIDQDHPANPMNPSNPINIFGTNPSQPFPFSHSAASMISGSPGTVDTSCSVVRFSRTSHNAFFTLFVIILKLLMISNLVIYSTS